MMHFKPSYISNPRTPAPVHFAANYTEGIILPELAPGFEVSVFSALEVKVKLPANNITPFLQTICRNDLQVHEYGIIASATRLSVFLRFRRWCGVFGYGGGK
jgi:hypothetical protein